MHDKKRAKVDSPAGTKRAKGDKGKEVGQLGRFVPTQSITWSPGGGEGQRQLQLRPCALHPEPQQKQRPRRHTDTDLGGKIRRFVPLCAHFVPTGGLRA